VPTGGRSAKPRGRLAGWSGLHRLGLLLLVETRVLEDVDQTSIKHGLGFDPLSPCVKYTPMVMMILTFGQLYFFIP
jgi:hypothetical protein